MKSYPVGELKSNFSNILELVQKGERKLGILKGKSKVTFAADFKMTEGE